MKRLFKWLLFLFLIFIGYQMFVFLFIHEHHHTYTIGKGKTKYTIHEHFQLVKQEHIYTFEIQDSKKRTYHFQVNENFHKRDKVIQKIETYQKGNMTCLYPVLLKQKQSDIVCNENKKEYSSTYYLMAQDDRIFSFIDTLEKKGYQNQLWNLESSKQEKSDVTYYPENIASNVYYYLWNYKGVTKISQKGVKKENIFKIDKYENNQSILVGDTLVVIDSDQKYDFDQLYLISMTTDKVETLKLKEKIPQDSYFCGQVDNKAYLIDRKNIRQYEIDLAKKKVQLIGNKESNAQYYNGTKWKTRNIYDFIQQDFFFQDEISKEITKNYPKATAFQGVERTYFLQDNQVFYVSHQYPKKPVFLFKMQELLEVQSIKNVLLFITKDTVYQYEPRNGLRKILTSRELLFNQKKMFGVVLKS